MTESSRAVSVEGVHRTIRVLADGEGPYSGELVSWGGAVAVRTPVAHLRVGAGWALAGAEHVAAPLDLAFRAEGLHALLPWCVRTVQGHLMRSGEGASVSRGEAVTLAVSMLRGVVELGCERAGTGESAEEPRGQWWLTDDARPVFVVPFADTVGGDPVCGAAQQRLRELEERLEDRTLRRLLLRLADALQEPRRVRAEAARWEQELLELAAPRPLHVVGEVHAGGALDVLRREQAPGPPAPRRRDLRSGDALPRRRSGTLPHGIVRGVEQLRRSLAGLRQAASASRAAETLSGLSRPVWPRTRQDPPAAGVSRRRWAGPALVAAGAAAVIVVGGALWPADGRSSAGAADHGASPRPAASPATTPNPAHSAASAEAGATPTAPEALRPIGPSTQQDPGVAAEELLSAARRCRVTPVMECGTLWEGGAASVKEVRDQEGPAALVEDYGDLAALRSGSGKGAQLVVILRRDAEWRIHDVYDIADPPSEGAGAP